ncbi:MAG: FliM/FliN family flagellar motor switch protein [Kofleriaceae bacterium]
MTDSGPNFSPFPYDQLRRVRRGDAAIETALARWLAARPRGSHKLAALFGGAPSIAILGVRESDQRSPTHVAAATVVGVRRRDERTARISRPPQVGFDRHAALAELRVGGMSILVAASLQPVRVLAQRLLGGPAELVAPRPPTRTDHAIWALVVAAAIEDFGLPAEVWPFEEPVVAADAIVIELAVTLAGTPEGSRMTVTAWCPRELVVQAPPVRPVPAWRFTLPVRVARCELSAGAIAALAVRDVVVVERGLALVVGDAVVALSSVPGSVEARVASDYIRRPMADPAHLELTVQLGTTQLALRELAALVPGQIISLGRPLAGPYEIRAAGTLIGQGELVDVDGELGVRIVSLIESEP